MPKRDRPWDEPSKPGAQGGAPLSTALKEVIVHMYYDEDMSIDEIYPLTKSTPKWWERAHPEKDGKVSH